MSASLYAKCGVAGRLATLAAAYTIGFVAKFQDCCGVCICVCLGPEDHPVFTEFVGCGFCAGQCVCVTHPTTLNETHVSMVEACSAVFAAHWATLE